jgi:hypothetical protein
VFHYCVNKPPPLDLNLRLLLVTLNTFVCINKLNAGTTCYTCEGIDHLLHVWGYGPLATRMRVWTTCYTYEGMDHLLHVWGCIQLATRERVWTTCYTCEGMDHLLHVWGYGPLATRMRVWTTCYTCGGMDQIRKTRDRIQWRKLVKRVINLGVSWKAKNLVNSWVTTSFSRRTLIHGINIDINTSTVCSFNTKLGFRAGTFLNWNLKDFGEHVLLKI